MLKYAYLCQKFHDVESEPWYYRGCRQRNGRFGWYSVQSIKPALDDPSFLLPNLQLGSYVTQNKL